MRQAHKLAAKVAEDYALSHTGDHLYVSDLCRAAAVSERTLEATPRTTTVSAEALNWGYWPAGGAGPASQVLAPRA